MGKSGNVSNSMSNFIMTSFKPGNVFLSQYCNVKRDNYILLQYIHIGSIGRKLRRIVDTVFCFLKVLTEP